MDYNLLQEFQKVWNVQFNTSPNPYILLAVSGGIDSMVLANLVLNAPIKFEIAHCNFQLRGEESEKDEAFVAQWCRNNNIRIHITRFDTLLKSVEWKKGIQETARILRYEYFEYLRLKFGYTKIATAHHANDNAETILLNLFRGTGIAGLHGIAPDSGYIIRPLLFATKEDIKKYAQENEIHYREDASNNTDDYTRNALRRNVIPVLEEWFPDAILKINESIAKFADAEILFRKAIENERKKLIEIRGLDLYIPILKLKKRKALATILYELLQPFGFNGNQIPQIIQLMDAETGHYISSPTHTLLKNRNFFIITTLQTETSEIILITSLPCTIQTATCSFDVTFIEKPQNLDVEPSIAFIDWKDLDFPLVLRKWKTGDYLYPLGMNMKKKKVSRLLIDLKVPLHEKKHIWVLEKDKKIIWVAGIRLDERFKVKPTTEKVLKIKQININI